MLSEPRSTDVNCIAPRIGLHCNFKPVKHQMKRVTETTDNSVGAQVAQVWQKARGAKTEMKHKQVGVDVAKSIPTIRQAFACTSNLSC
jgi:type IV secretory pathway TrbL component